jgi:hypothetical protein
MMLAELDGVCWVSDKDAAWMARIPSARIRQDAETTVFMVVDGAARFEPHWCHDRRRCDDVPDYAFTVQPPRCPGHGRWRAPPNLRLDALVKAVSRGTVCIHQVTAWRESTPSRYGEAGKTIWTTEAHAQQEQEQLAAAAAFEHHQRAQEAEELRHSRHIEALLLRQQTLIKPTVDHVYRETGTDVSVPKPPRDPYWAMGVPVSVPAGPYAIVCPVASRIDTKVRSRLAPLLLVVADEHERARLAAKCEPSQRILVIAT